MNQTQSFKDAMTQMATGVTIVTCMHEGTAYGMTVSSFTSVSIEPPLVSICIDKRVTIGSIIEKSARFSVNILSAKQENLGKIFSTPSMDMNQRFTNGTWNSDQTLSPVLDNCLAWMDCNLHSTFEVGDHYIFIGEVKSSFSKTNGRPVIYFQRQWQNLKS
ncbi:MAG: flavin reductase family protein [bacterium]|nr:flavin reductase family protein [bacterium]